jgi:hypothetical protein
MRTTHRLPGAAVDVIANPAASLHNAARRLRYLRAYPHLSTAAGVQTPAEKAAAAAAFDWALRVLLDECGLSSTPEWSAHYYGPAGELQENDPLISA